MVQYLINNQLARLKAGEGKVPVTIVLYMDGTYLKKGIPIRSDYRKCIYIIPGIVPDVTPDITAQYNMVV
jgi:hypothetical protein